MAAAFDRGTHPALLIGARGNRVVRLDSSKSIIAACQVAPGSRIAVPLIVRGIGNGRMYHSGRTFNYICRNVDKKKKVAIRSGAGRRLHM
jgi:hypothetical protein